MLEDSPELVMLATDRGARAAIYPAEGFNCVGLELVAGGRPVNVMHAEPDVLTGGSPTRSGMPVLFPFPNRIADATFTWKGVTYRIPVTHPGDRHAIHGFACRVAWTDYERSADGTALTGRFRLSRDAEDGTKNWPGDLELRLTYRLSDDSLTVSSEVINVDDREVPFGLGFHAYLAPLAAGTGRDAVDSCHVWCDAQGFWVLDDSIPTGDIEPVAGSRELRDDPILGERVLDDVLTDLAPYDPGATGLMPRASLTGGDARLDVECDDQWRDIVVFTPENRESVAIEPYTCPTDAVHLDQRGLPVGWHVLAPGERWASKFRLSIASAQ